MAEAHVSDESRDQIQGVGERRPNEQAGHQGQEESGNPGRRTTEDEQEDSDAPERRPDRKNRPQVHRRMPSGRSKRTGMRIRKAAASARERLLPRKSWPTLMITPNVNPPTRLPHILPGPPRTTMTKLIGAYRFPIAGKIPGGRQTVRTAPPPIVMANATAVPRDATRGAMTR